MFLKYYNFLPYIDISWNLNLEGFCIVGTVKIGLYMYVTSSNIQMFVYGYFETNYIQLYYFQINFF